MEKKLSILAPTHNRPEVLNLVWKSWLNQKGIFQIVVVDDGSTDDYSSVFREMRTECDACNVRLDVVRLTERSGAPAAKNAGLKLCLGDEVLTTDDDIVLEPQLVENLRRENPSKNMPVILGPRVLYLKDGESDSDAILRTSTEKSPYFNYENLTLLAWANPDKNFECPFVTAVALWPSSFFQRGLKYFEGYGGNGYREESDPQLVAQEMYGAKVFLIPSATCFHLPPGIAYARKSGQRRGGVLWFEGWVLRNNAVFLWRHRDLLRKKYGLRIVRSWFSLFFSRFTLARGKVFFKKYFF